MLQKMSGYGKGQKTGFLIAQAFLGHSDSSVVWLCKCIYKKKAVHIAVSRLGRKEVLGLAERKF